MLTTELLIVVGARLNSSRLPKKHLLDLAGKPLIARLIDRLSYVKAPHKTIIATTNDDYNQPLVALAKQIGVECLAFDGSVDDLVGRIDVAVNNSSAKYIAYICGDCPLVDPALIDKFYQALLANTSAKFSGLKDKRKSIHEGIAVYSRAGWQQLVELSNEPAEREHVGLSLKKATNIATQTAYIEEEEIYFGCDHRISVDTQADYQFMSAIYERWYRQNEASSIMPLSWVINTLASNQSIKQLNQQVMQKAAHKAYQKVMIVTEAGSNKGLGQLTRCLNLSQSLQENHGLGTELIILADDVPSEKLQFVNHQIFTSEQSLLSILESQKDKSILFDLFPSRLTMPEQWQQQLKVLSEKNKHVLGIDRCAEWQPLFDHLWIPSFYCNRTELANVDYGWQHYMVKAVSRQPIANQLLILTGGSDALNYSDWLPNWLDKHLPMHIKPVWLQGPYSPAPKFSEPTRLSWQVLIDPEHMTQHLAQASYVLSVYGVTLFEALASKIPTVVLPSVPLISAEEYFEFSQQNIATCLTNDFTQATAEQLNSALSSNTISDIKQLEIADKIKGGLANTSAAIADFINQVN